MGQVMNLIRVTQLFAFGKHDFALGIQYNSWTKQQFIIINFIWLDEPGDMLNTLSAHWRFVNNLVLITDVTKLLRITLLSAG